MPEPFVPLTDEDEEIVREALHGRNRFDSYLLLSGDAEMPTWLAVSKIVLFCSRERLAVHEPSNIVITREILQCLNNQEWLNDEVFSCFCHPFSGI